MAETINLNDIRSGTCNCNRPSKPVQLATTSNCHKASSTNDLYFKVSNLFGELSSEWQRAEARSNLGISEIINLELIKFGNGSGDSNVWQLDIMKEGQLKTSYLVVKNGSDGKPGKNGRDGRDGITPTIEIGTVTSLEAGEQPTIDKTDTENGIILNFGIPQGSPGEPGSKGETGSKGDTGLSAYELYVANGGTLSLSEWLLSLKADNDDYKITKVSQTKTQNDSITVDNKPIDVKKYIWQIMLNNGDTFEFWAPLNLNVGNTNYKHDIFLFKVIPFMAPPSMIEINNTITQLEQEFKGKTELYLTDNGWKYSADRINNPTLEFLFMAHCIVDNGNYGTWSVLSMSGIPGQTPESIPGPLGLTGPVIRIRGEYNKGEHYYNLSNLLLPVGSTTIRYIDVVWKTTNNETTNLEETKWYMVKAVRLNEETVIIDIAPPNDDYWIEAEGIDFAFIKVLIANYISALTIDTDEVRIHSHVGHNDDTIVAGMTGGKSVDGHQQVNAGEATNPIRIWAGTSTSINDSEIDISLAPFRVTLSGDLFAEKANVKGSIEAQELMLGEHTSSVPGTFICPEENSPITLPELKDNKIQMFFILTVMLSSTTILIKVPDNSTDVIKYRDTLDSPYNTARNCYLFKDRLYQLFGIDNVWYVVEIDTIAASRLHSTLIPGKDFKVNATFRVTPDFSGNDFIPEVSFSINVLSLVNEDIDITIGSITLTRLIQLTLGTIQSTYNGNVTIRITKTNPTEPIIIHLSPNGTVNGTLTTVQGTGHALSTIGGDTYTMDVTVEGFTGISENLDSSVFNTAEIRDIGEEIGLYPYDITLNGTNEIRYALNLNYCSGNFSNN